jgi:hypothetical protein
MSRSKVPSGAVSYEANAVLAGAYRGKAEQRATLVHAVWVDVDGRMVGVKTVCARVPVDSLCDVSESAVTCAVCKERVDRSGLRRVEANPSPKWRKLMVRGELSGAIKRETERASGAYAVRKAGTHEVLYVGESSRGRMWRTLLRHFQAPESFRKVRETGVFATDASQYEVAIWVTAEGARPRSSGKAGDQAALDAQAEWIRTLKPSKNKDDGLAGDFVYEQSPEEGAFDGLLNPAGRWTALGLLTRLTYAGEGGRERVLRWGLRGAPTLVYDDRGRMAIAYGKAPVRAATGQERREYARTHWGRAGQGEVLSGSVALPPFRELGPALVITYTTAKGSAEVADWVHPFGEGARGKWAPPRVVEHVCRGARCAAKGRVSLRGGTYRVTDRGIVG